MCLQHSDSILFLASTETLDGNGTVHVCMGLMASQNAGEPSCKHQPTKLCVYVWALVCLVHGGAILSKATAAQGDFND